MFTSSIGGIAVADAIDAAAEQLRPGDVLLIELQGTGPRGRFLPVEYWDDNFDAIQAATAPRRHRDRGRRQRRRGPRSQGVQGQASTARTRDSGAIMVGAGGPPREGFTDRARLDFSNYGTRVDVQGWGRKVATLDYGDLQRCARRAPTATTPDEFSGTSSASPIVAGAAVLRRELVAQTRDQPLAPAVVRDLLRRTGTPQTDGIGGSSHGFTTGFACTSGGCVDFAPQQNIGPRPDLSRALDAVER